MKLTKEQGNDLAYNCLPGWELVRGTENIIDQRRWVTTHEAVFLHVESGKHYRMCYDLGSTECQDDMSPFEYDEPSLIEVTQREVTRLEWVEAEQ